MKNFFIEHRKGLFGTIVFHILLVVVFIIFGFTTPLPLPGEEGILINFGVDDDGSGLIEPSAAAQPPQETVSVPETTSAEDAASESAEEEILTQELEEAPKVQTAPQKDPEAERKEREAREAEQKRLDELERQRLEELERQRQISEIQDRTRNALESARNNADNTSKSEEPETRARKMVPLMQPAIPVDPADWGTKGSYSASREEPRNRFLNPNTTTRWKELSWWKSPLTETAM
jgi:colicin import membrane protein